jgi:hypothetical protein
LYRRLGGPQGPSGQVQKILPPPEFDPQTVQPIASRYTNYATRPTINQYHILNNKDYGIKILQAKNIPTRILKLDHFRFVFLRHYYKTLKINHSPSIYSTLLPLMYCTINIKTRITIFEDLLVLILIQADLACNFHLHDFTLMQLTNVQHFPNLCDHFFGIDDTPYFSV